ncbi:pancreatic lipase-related protein 2 isoform X2 [Ceratitis capitata]|uniref:Pancreatic lipase-related protein 2 n=3 Tax=Ceratitis capitata TaxID=7213 RepID=W8C942_CERCA|nr:pancreatic lipase-related protein 2 isoform X2 [Ceratitis capitata]
MRNGNFDINPLHCRLLRTDVCPHKYLGFHLYTEKSPRRGVTLNIHNPLSLFKGGFSRHRETAIIIHGFNGTAVDMHLQFLKDAYLSRDFNVITVDWRPLTRYPCYLHALINTRLTAQCTAQVYSFLTHHGAIREKITCIGHSLGAHICGMISNHLSLKQHRIIGLDPARPLIERKKGHIFRLSIDDASVIQVLHTNAGYLGQEENVGHLNYCVNGGKFQPFCKGNPIRRSRCSHFLSICYLASAMFKHKKFLGVSCPNGCVELSGPKRLPVSTKNPFGAVSQIRDYHIGNDAPDDARGCYCIDMPYVKHCPFND